MASNTMPQQPMASERLAQIREFLSWNLADGMPQWVAGLCLEYLSESVTEQEVDEMLCALHAEVLRQRTEAVLLRAQADGAAALLIDVQQECVGLRSENRELREIAWMVANGGTAEDFSQRAPHHLLGYHVYASQEARQRARVVLDDLEDHRASKAREENDD